MLKIGKKDLKKQAVKEARKGDLIDAALHVIHEKGSLDVTVAKIADRAGVSAGLALHYFGSKEALLDSAMCHLLTELSRAISLAMKSAKSDREAIRAIIGAAFSKEQFSPLVVSAWFSFYVSAQSSDTANRLFRIYTSRLRSNLAFAFKKFMDRDSALHSAEIIASLIDGLWLRYALKQQDPNMAISLVDQSVDLLIRNQATNTI